MRSRENPATPPRPSENRTWADVVRATLVKTPAPWHRESRLWCLGARMYASGIVGDVNAILSELEAGRLPQCRLAVMTPAQLQDAQDAGSILGLDPRLGISVPEATPQMRVQTMVTLQWHFFVGVGVKLVPTYHVGTTQLSAEERATL